VNALCFGVMGIYLYKTFEFMLSFEILNSGASLYATLRGAISQELYTLACIELVIVIVINRLKPSGNFTYRQV
jgi:hypothetical protein